MRSDLSDITVVLDRSGSMQSCKDDAEGGLNNFISEQKKLPGDAMFTLVQFDTVYEFVHTGINLKDAPPCKLEPRGGTALLDAVGRAIVETGERLKKIEQKERPGLVAFVIVTDGGENASREFALEKIKEMIKHQQEAYKWQFTFLGANQDAFAAAGNMGIARGGIANYAAAAPAQAFASASANLGRMRSATAKGAEVKNAYTDEERQKMN